MKMLLVLFSVHWRLIIYFFDGVIFKLKMTNNRSFLYSKLYRFSKIHEISYLNLNNLGVINDEDSIYQTSSSITVIVAGPYVKHLGFTNASIKRLRILLPTSTIIYSTDSYLSSKTVTYLRKLNVDILRNSKAPFNDNTGNLRAQITNVVSALKTISDSESYILRVRSDQLIQNSDFIGNLMTFNKLYNKSNNRITKLSMNSYINRNFSTSDMFMFGKHRSLLNYWDINERLIIESIEKLKISKFPIIPESILDSIYFKKIYGNFPNTDSDYCKLIRNQYLIVDEPYVAIAWYKQPLFNDSTRNKNLKELTHLIWLKLYLNDSNSL